ncbi:MAG: sugar phosphate isomerase/epimerase family protein [Endomicrobiales bacterium]
MRFGRNFTNLLNYRFLTSEERQELGNGALSVADMDCRVQREAKADIPGQLRAAKELGLSHVEFDGNVPNPFLDLGEGQKEKAREFLRESGLSASFHIPFGGVAAATASLQETDRKIAVALVIRYLELASALGCRNVNMHAGAVPQYHTRGEYRDKAVRSAVASLSELLPRAEEKNLVLHLENNTAFDAIGSGAEECAGMISAAAKAAGGTIKFCFDAGHWLSLCGPSSPHPEGLADAVRGIPGEMLAGAQVHLHDYVPGERKFHYPLHLQRGLLNRQRLQSLLRALEDKGVDAVILETAAHEACHACASIELMKDEQAYLGKALGEAG